MILWIAVRGLLLLKALEKSGGTRHQTATCAHRVVWTARQEDGPDADGEEGDLPHEGYHSWEEGNKLLYHKNLTI